MSLPPAWRITYGIRLVDPEGVVTSITYLGSCSVGRFVLEGSLDEQLVAQLAVISEQPYLDDAAADCLRAARDFCTIESISLGESRVLEPVLPALNSERLVGAKDMPSGGRGLIDSATLSATITLGTGEHPARLEAAERLGNEPRMRAHLDTWRAAVLQDEEPVRFLQYCRILEDWFAELVDAEPPLLTDGEVETCVQAALQSLPPATPGLERVESSLRSNIKKIRVSSRTAVIADALQIDREQASAITATRGRHAHTPSLIDEQIAPGLEARVRAAATAYLKRELGLAPKGDVSA